MFELFILKLLDMALSTAKNVFLIKNKNLLSALCSTGGAFLFFAMVSKIAEDDSIYAMMLVCLATFIGTYLPGVLFKKMEKDRVYVYDITPPTSEQGKEFADLMRENNLPVFTYKGYDLSKNQVLCCKIFSVNKVNSKMIETMIPEEFKYHVIETKNYDIPTSKE